jgi:hypothetical protein
MPWLLAGVAGVGFVELLMRLPILPRLAEFRATVFGALSVVRSVRISDHWKEKVLPRYALRLFRLTMVLAVYFGMAFVPFMALYLLSVATGVRFLEFAVSLAGILFVTVVSCAYAMVRFRRGTKFL